MSGEKVATEIFEVHTPGMKAKFLDWIQTRNGVIVWRDQEITTHPKPDQFAPKVLQDGTDGALAKPHWSYGVFEVVTDITRFKFVKKWVQLERSRVRNAERRRAQLAAEKNICVFYTFDGADTIFETPEWEE